MGSNRLTGDLPPSLPCSFPLLQTLDARHNELEGSLPPVWWGEHAGGFVNLQFL